MCPYGKDSSQLRFIVALSLGVLLSCTKAVAVDRLELPLGVPQSVTVNSPDRSGVTKWWVKKGQVLRLSVSKNQVWYDWFQKSDLAGYEPITGPFVDVFKRVPDAKFFQVVACVDDRRWLTRSDFFVLSPKGDHYSVCFTARRTGTLNIFANDIDFMYWNNHGSVHVVVTRIR